MSHDQPVLREVHLEKFKFKSRHYLLILVASVLIFGLGFAFGDGKISLKSASKISNSNSSNKELEFDQLNDIYSELKENFDGSLDDKKLLDGAKKGLATATGDAYTEYFNDQEAEDFNSDLSGSFEGIGAELGKQDDFVVIIAPIAGTPADKAGLRPKDIIIEINGENASGISITEAVKKIRGPKDSEVKLKLVRDGQPIEVAITRGVISIPSVKWEVTSDNIGIMTISRFGTDTEDLALEAAQDFKSKKVKAVILDMRGNPGGLLNSAVTVSNIWLAKGKTILEEKRGDTLIKKYTASKAPILEGIKTVVLIDEGSASASEITAGALKDNGAAELVGKKSYGKGSVQNLIELASGGTVKITIARWYTPNGKNIDKEGIAPDHEVERTVDDIKANKDPQKDKAFQLVR